MRYLEWIKDSDLTRICTELAENFHANASDEVNFKNKVDPFSALFDIALNDMSYDDWMNNERIRQRQKTLQNMIGNFHQNVLGCISGWENKAVGDVVDLVCPDKKIIAEVKNKYNTIKGSEKINLFNNFAHALKYGYHGYTAYYVTVIAKKPLNVPFAPSDNSKKAKPEANENIREIDGASFYAIATGSETALADLYSVLPNILAKITDTDAERIKGNPLFSELFARAIK